MTYAVYLLHGAEVVLSRWYQASPYFLIETADIEFDAVRYFVRDGLGEIRATTQRDIRDAGPAASRVLIDEGVVFQLQDVRPEAIPFIPSDFFPRAMSITAEGGWISIVPASITERTENCIDLLPTGRVNWEMTFPSGEVQNRMWLYSLDFVGRLCAEAVTKSDMGILRIALAVTRDFMEFVKSSEARSRVDCLPSSAAHATATRMRALIKLWKVAYESGFDIDGETRSDLLAEVVHCCSWLAREENFHQTNHGVMGANALMLAGRFLGCGSGDSASDRIFELGLSRVLEIARVSFDRDGLCYENTIGYHNFNLGMYRQALKFLSECGVDNEEYRELEHIVTKGLEALAYCIRSDSTIPPIGDSPVYKVPFRSINSSKCFNESGFLVIKNDDLYVSLICGSRSEFHKQMDDSSLTVRYRGEDLIIDGGSYSYDRVQGHGRYVESASAHSGVFPAAINQLRRRDVLGKLGRVSGAIDSFDEHDWGAIATCHYGIGGKFMVRRTLIVQWPATIRIVDTVLLDDLGPGVKQRLLLGPTVVPEKRDDRDAIHWATDTLRGTLHFSGVAHVERACGEMQPEIRGSYSEEFGKIEKTWVVESDLEGPLATATTLIEIAEK